ncbi:MAG: hypothetical protein HY822_23175 [Acidobacteria bacterium]|nr:hypothetical protein [Acidobacteriota bacterium]
MVCLRIILGLVLALAAGGQTPSDLFEKAPPRVDQSLRARVAKFYQAHVDGKFRLADQVVADDSKDAFFAADKPRYKGFEIVKIVYGDNYSAARVVTVCDTEMVSPMAGRFPIKAPLTSLWKIIDREWFLYIPPNTGVIDTPFGKMGAGQTSGNASSPIPARLPDAQSVQRQVRVDRTAVELSSYEPASAQVVVSSQMPGLVKLSLSYAAFPGFEAKLDRDEIGAGEKATVLFTCKPAGKTPKPAITVLLMVEQTRQEFPIRVTFRVPPEVQQRLPGR